MTKIAGMSRLRRQRARVGSEDGAGFEVLRGQSMACRLFIWTGFDYRGSRLRIAGRASVSHFGIMDTCGFPKNNYYYYQSWWTDKDILHIYPHWTGRARKASP